MRLLVLSRYTRLGASSRIRFYQYFPDLVADGWDITVAPLLGDSYLTNLYKGAPRSWADVVKSYGYRVARLLGSNRFDIIWIEKELFPWVPGWAEAMLAKFNLPYIIDYDDDIFVSYQNVRNPIVRAVLTQKRASIFRHAVLIVAGNEFLVEHAREAGATSVEYLPTVVDLDHYPIKPRAEEKIFTIGWIGSPMTSHYLQGVHAALVEFCRRRNARLRLIGSGPYELSDVPIEVLPWSEETEAEDIRSFDVGIMPLIDGPWERGKCSYKLIQYMASSIPVIASPVGVNRTIVEHGVNGFLADSSEDWCAALEKLWQNPELRAQMGAAGREKVENELCLQVTAPRLVSLLNRVAQTHPRHIPHHRVTVQADQAARPLKILHVITGLTTGGAEIMLYKLLKTVPRSEVSSRVVSLTEIGPIGERIRELGISVDALGMGRGFPSPLKILALARLMRHHHPDVVQAWMYHANLMAGLAARLAGSPPVIWGIRQSDLDPKTSKFSTRLVVKLGAWLSRPLASHILCCADQARRVHVDLGYAKDLMSVIPNGFDTKIFRPDAEARRAVRQELEIPETAPLVGLIGRFDPQKDHQTFFEAVRRIHQHDPGVYFLLAGDGVEFANPAFRDVSGDNGLASYCRLLGRRRDVPRLTAALDIAVSSSAFGEGFSNTIGEAMATAVPCVVTDVGDSAAIVGATGRVVVPRDSQALADAIADLIALGPEGRANLGQAARRRIEDNFALAAIAERYMTFYREALDTLQTTVVLRQ